MIDQGKFDEIPQKVSAESKKESKKYFTDSQAAINVVFVIAIYIVGISFVVLFIVRIMHFILPTSNHWLDPTQVENLDRFLFSGIAGALVGKHIDAVLNKHRI